MSDFEKLGAILNQEQKRLWSSNPRLGLQALWRQAAGEELAAETEVVALRDGVMTVACESGCRVSELRLRGAGLTEPLNRLGPPEPVREIRFIHSAGGSWKYRK